VLVTGAAGAIGWAAAELLAAQGWSLTLVDRAWPEARARDADALGARVRTLDLKDMSAVGRLLESEAECDAFAGVAGIGPTASILEQDVDRWREVFDVNVVPNLVLIQGMAKAWIGRRHPGSVVVVSSWIGARPWPGTAAYSASKAALDQLVRSAALELAPYGIRVNGVAPGILGEGMAGEEARRDPQYGARVARAVPLGGLQTAAEVAEGIGFLLSQAAASVTGTVLLLDRGASLISGAGRLDL
jgi:3-oxoacyl-[acyl-carrier protein] reductase